MRLTCIGTRIVRCASPSRRRRGVSIAKSIGQIDAIVVAVEFDDILRFANGVEFAFAAVDRLANVFQEPVFLVVIDTSDVVNVFASEEGDEFIAFFLFSLANLIEVGTRFDDIGREHEQEILLLNRLFGRSEQIAQDWDIAQ